MDALYEGGPLTSSLPCVLHTYHSPVSIVQELHHVLPEYLQKRVWGSTRIKTRVPVCGTGHSNIHLALTTYLTTGRWPGWCVGSTRDLAALAVSMYQEAMDA